MNARRQVNVRDTYFAASTYYRAADFYLRGNWDDPLLYSLWTQQIECFNKGLESLGFTAERKTIHAPAGYDIETIYYSADPPDAPASSRKKRPTMILGQGYDGAQEEAFHFFVKGALDRGYNVITYEGPGQPSVRRYQNLGFVVKWEEVVDPVIDYLCTRSEVDEEKLSLFGFSFGGYLAARAAAYIRPENKRKIKALMLDGGIYDAYESFTQQLPPALLKLYQSGDKQKFDNIINGLLDNDQTPSQLRWGVQQGL